MVCPEEWSGVTPKPSLCSTGRPSLRPDLPPERRRAQWRSRIAIGDRGAARSVLDGREHGARLGQVGSEGAACSCRRPIGLQQRAIAGVAAQAAWAVENGEAAVGIFVNPYRGAHKMRSRGGRRDLEAAPVPFDGVVVADLAL